MDQNAGSKRRIKTQDQNAGPKRRTKTQEHCGKSGAPHQPAELPAQPVLSIMAWPFDKKIFENESVFPAIERSAAADAAHFRVNRRYGLNLHQRVLCRAMRAVERTRV
jgi:hypothetical protein